MKKKYHKWKRVEDSEIYKHHICIYCGLEKATKKLSFWDYRDYYFRRDKNGEMIEGGYSQIRVPYPCTGPGLKIDDFLPEELFEI